MPGRMLIATAAIALSVGVASGQQQQVANCEDRLDQLAAEYGDVFGADGEVGRPIPAALDDLRSAAMRLVAQGRADECNEVIEAMRLALAGYEAAGPTPGTRTEARPAPGAGLTEAEIEARLVPVSETGLDSAAIEGAEVYNYDSDKLGEVDGFLFGAGRPTHLVVSHGGFWKIRGGIAAIPVDIVRWDPEWQAFFAPLTEEVLDDAPAYGSGNSVWDQEMNDRYFADASE